MASKTSVFTAQRRIEMAFLLNPRRNQPIRSEDMEIVAEVIYDSKNDTVTVRKPE